jgi:hypothetical protein
LDLIPQLTFGAGIPGNNTAGTGAPTISWDARFPIDAIDLRWSAQDNFTWTAGRHLVKTGVYYEYNINSEGFSAPAFSGCLNFQSDGTTAAQNPFNTNYPYANALLGYYTSYQENNVRPFRGANQTTLEWFGQDSWRVNSRLSLELGMRFSAGSPWQLLKSGWKGYNPPAGERAAAWLAAAYNPAGNPKLYQPACPPPAATCAAGARLAKNPLTGEILPNSNALIGQLVPNSGDFYNGIIRDNDPRSYDGVFQPSPGVKRSRASGSRGIPTGTAQRRSAADTDHRSSCSTRPAISRTRSRCTSRFVSSRRSSTALCRTLASVPSVFSTVGGHRLGGRGGFRMCERRITSRSKSSGTSVQHARDRGLRRQSSAWIADHPRPQPGAGRGAVRSEERRSHEHTAAPSADAFLRPIPEYTSITERTREGYTDYNSMQVTANHRLTGGVAFGMAYTLAKTEGLSGGVAHLSGSAGAQLRGRQQRPASYPVVQRVLAHP